VAESGIRTRVAGLIEPRIRSCSFCSFCDFALKLGYTPIMALPHILESSAIFSPDRIYRYSLTRVWDRDRPCICFVMLNPSAADDTINDPTIRRCIGFSNDWGCGSIVVVNLFAYRTHDPRVLATVQDPFGAENEKHITEAVASCSLTMAAWGVHGHAHESACRLLSRLPDPYCLGVTKHGAPRHPLYVDGAAKPTPYR